MSDRYSERNRPDSARRTPQQRSYAASEEGRRRKAVSSEEARRRAMASEAARKKASMQAAREAKRRQQQRIRIVTILIAVIVLIGIIVIIAVSCSRKKAVEPQGSSSVEPASSTAKESSIDDAIASIPTENIPATTAHDDIQVTDANPIQGTDGSYSIHVNTALNAVTVYDANGQAVRVLTCSTGRRDGHETPEGTFTLGEWIILPWNEWCYMADGTEGLYAYRIIDNINNDIMFHSVPYFETDHGTLEYEEYNKLGDYASMGCIRMCTADCRWLGELCATGTEVVIYYDPNEQLPMEKPVSYKIPTEIVQLRGWDPTDPISTNPWHNYTIDLQVPNSVIAKKDVDYAIDPARSAATATDSYGNDLSAYLSTVGTYDASREGVYTVRVSCDVGPCHAYKDVYVIVEE